MRTPDRRNPGHNHLANYLELESLIVRSPYARAGAPVGDLYNSDDRVDDRDRADLYVIDPLSASSADGRLPQPIGRQCRQRLLGSPRRPRSEAGVGESAHGGLRAAEGSSAGLGPASELLAWLLEELQRDERSHAGRSPPRLEASCTERSESCTDCSG